MVSTLEPWNIESEEGLCEFEISKSLLINIQKRYNDTVSMTRLYFGLLL